MTTALPPFVSVIVPTRGRREMLLRLLRSLFAQTYPKDRFEILVIHNWTPDGTEEAVAALAAGAPVALRYWRKDYAAPTDSRHFALGEATGGIFAFTDDDCEATADWLSAGVAGFADGIGVVQGCTLPRPDQPRRFLEKTIEIRDATPYFETCNIFYRREAILGVGGFSPEYHGRWYGEDTDLGWKVLRRGWRRGFAPAALVHHEVFAAPLLAWLKEPLRLGVWPELVRKFPELRGELWLGCFLSPETAAFALAVVAAVAALALHPAALLAILPYVVVRWHNGGRFGNPVLRLARIALGLPRAAAIFWALASASVRHRTFVL
ncbi:MAG: glycosyltransferase [Alphaproteobacteria bacterium]|nr:glycosyltransferase [Alphaproteobacteria bacterium]